MLKDFGIEVDIRVMTDATTGKAIASRRGLGKLRHIATHELWVQDLVLNGCVQLIKIKNNFNTSDCFTKHLNREMLDEAISQFRHRVEDGRSEAAPELSLLWKAKENENAVYLVPECVDVQQNW